jgi:hypothetical protein
VEEDEAVFVDPKRLPLPPILDGGNADLKGAGVEVGVVVCGLTTSSTLAVSSVESISSSFETVTSRSADALLASPRAAPKALPNKELLSASDFVGPSFLADPSALNVEPRTKLFEAAPNSPDVPCPTLSAVVPKGDGLAAELRLLLPK